MSAVPNVHMTKKVSFTLFSYLFFLKLFHLQARQKCHWYRGGYRLWMWEKTLSISGTFFTCKYAVCHLNHSSYDYFLEHFFLHVSYFQERIIKVAFIFLALLSRLSLFFLFPNYNLNLDNRFYLQFSTFKPTFLQDIWPYLICLILRIFNLGLDNVLL